MTISRIRRDVLYLVHRVPYPPDKGDRIRAFHLVRFLSGLVNVHLACLADEPVSREALLALGRLCARVAIVPHRGLARWLRGLGSLLRGCTVTEGVFSSPALRRVLRGWARETHFHAALASASSMVPYLRVPELKGVPAVVDLVDVDSEKWLDYAAESRGPAAWLYRVEGRRLRRLERELPRWARAVTLVSEAEAALYRRFAAPGAVLAVTNGVDLHYFHPMPAADEQGCVFVGALDYRPNVEGAVWFCREVWPELRRRDPQARLVLVGRRPVPAVRRLAELPGVEVAGTVPDVRPFVARAAVVVVPLRLARGVQNKVLEALAMGKSTVVSPQALEGLAAKPGAEVVVASTPQEWVAAVAALLADPQRRQALGAAGRRYVERHHEWDHCLEPFGRLLGLAPQVNGTGAQPSLARRAGVGSCSSARQANGGVIVNSERP
jgi:sugar transferase (PEP-CTERM/EpsH1 system associated)